MAYTPVKTVDTGDPWTANDMNKYVRENFGAGVPDIFSAKGQIAVGTGDNMSGVVSPGPDGTMLLADSAQASGVKFDYNPIVKSAKAGKAQLVTTNGAGYIGTAQPLTYKHAWVAKQGHQSMNIYFQEKPFEDFLAFGVSRPRVVTVNALKVAVAVTNPTSGGAPQNYAKLMVDSTKTGGLAWRQTNHYANVGNSVAYSPSSVPPSESYKVRFSAIGRYDPEGLLFDGGPPTFTYYRVPEAGYYYVAASLSGHISPFAGQDIQLCVNDDYVIDRFDCPITSGVGYDDVEIRLTGALILYCSKDDQITLTIKNNVSYRTFHFSFADHWHIIRLGAY